MLLVDLLEGVGAVVWRHLRDEGGGLARRDRLEEFGAQLLVEILEDVRGARRAERGEELRELLAIEQLGDVGEIGRVHLLRLGGDVGRRFLEQRRDVGREQGRDRAVFWISLRWRHAVSLLSTPGLARAT